MLGLWKILQLCLYQVPAPQTIRFWSLLDGPEAGTLTPGPPHLLQMYFVQYASYIYTIEKLSGQYEYNTVHTDKAWD